MKISSLGPVQPPAKSSLSVDHSFLSKAFAHCLFPNARCPFPILVSLASVPHAAKVARTCSSRSGHLLGPRLARSQGACRTHQTAMSATPRLRAADPQSGSEALPLLHPGPQDSPPVARPRMEAEDEEIRRRWLESVSPPKALGYNQSWRSKYIIFHIHRGLSRISHLLS